MSDSRNATAPAITAAGDGVSVGRRFTEAGVSPFDAVEWEIRDALIGDPESPAFEQRGVEFPKSWSQNSTNIVAQKYFRGRMDSPERESSVKQMIGRVAGTIAELGSRGQLLRERGRRPGVRRRAHPHPSSPDGGVQLARLVQRGLRGDPQCSACFILSVEDDLSRSSTGTPRRAGSSAAGRAPASTSRRSAARRSTSRRAGSPRARSASCAAPTPGPARSSRVARHGARPRWSCSTSTTRTSSTSSGARRARRRRRRPCATRASTCASTPSIRLDPVPERQQLGARDRRVHGARRARRGVGAERARNEPARSTSASTPRTCSTRSPTPPGAAPIRASSTTRRSTSGTPARTRAGSTRRTRASPATPACTRRSGSSHSRSSMSVPRPAKTSACTRTAQPRMRPPRASSLRDRSRLCATA